MLVVLVLLMASDRFLAAATTATTATATTTPTTTTITTTTATATATATPTTTTTTASAGLEFRRSCLYHHAEDQSTSKRNLRGLASGGINPRE